MAEKRKIKDLRKGDKIKVHGKVVTVESGPICFKRNNDTWGFDVRQRGAKSCSTLSFKDGEKEVELKEESPHEPIPDELREMTKYLDKPKRRRKKK
ncbi:MAG: hypothetical protein ACWGQW_15530 [bacterium]